MKYLLIALLAISLSASASNQDFCAGFRQGYIDGYKQAHHGMFPLVPVCPVMPKMSVGDSGADYRLGYLVGVRKSAVAY